MATIIKIDPNSATADQLQPAVDILRAGGVVAGPTQTFYGLMAAVDRMEALARIQWLKGRDSRKPLLLLLDTPQRMAEYAKEIPEAAAALAKAFWPGPLTILTPSVPGLHPSLVGSGGTVALRVEGLPVIRTLVRALGRAVTGTSANPGGQPPAVTAEEVVAYFGEAVDLVLDGGPCPGNRPSTLVEVSHPPARLIREGAIPRDALTKVIPDLI